HPSSALGRLRHLHSFPTRRSSDLAETKGNAAPGYLNERLMSDLRPTLFLAQLSNLLAGNIAIVHGVTGCSRTFMGEEASGVDARSEEHTSELQSRENLVCRLLLDK